MKSSLAEEECAHKLSGLQIPVRFEKELINIIVETCSQERTYSAFYGIVAERMARSQCRWNDLFCEAFEEHYDTIHRFDSRRLRGIAQLFSHLLATEAIGWRVLSVIQLNERDTTLSNRIFTKHLFEDLTSTNGIALIKSALASPLLQAATAGLLPTPAPQEEDVRFSVNFFTQIGLGTLTDGMRQDLHMRQELSSRRPGLGKSETASAYFTPPPSPARGRKRAYHSKSVDTSSESSQSPSPKRHRHSSHREYSHRSREVSVNIHTRDRG
jgi:pre-mRNA-splicing factor CWC22